MASVFVMCQFSYPFHYAVVWFMAVLAAVPAFFKYRPHADSRPVPPVIRVPVALLLLIVLAFLLRAAYLDMKWAEMSKRCLSGYTERMLPYYARMKHIRQRNPLFLYNYAAELNYAGRYSESVAVVREWLWRAPCWPNQSRCLLPACARYSIMPRLYWKNFQPKTLEPACSINRHFKSPFWTYCNDFWTDCNDFWTDCNVEKKI